MKGALRDVRIWRCVIWLPRLACGSNLKASNNCLERTNSEKVHYGRQENCLILGLLSPQFAEAQNQSNEEISTGTIPSRFPCECLTVSHLQEGSTFQSGEGLEATWEQLRGQKKQKWSDKSTYGANRKTWGLRGLKSQLSHSPAVWPPDNTLHLSGPPCKRIMLLKRKKNLSTEGAHGRCSVIINAARWLRGEALRSTSSPTPY